LTALTYHLIVKKFLDFYFLKWIKSNEVSPLNHQKSKIYSDKNLIKDTKKEMTINFGKIKKGLLVDIWKEGKEEILIF
jgi:hypothetical protein